MQNGFLGYDSSLMLDVVVCALIVVVPALLYSLYLVKIKKRFTAHRNCQIGLAVVLLVAVLAFEVDIRLHGGWENIVNKVSDAPRIQGEDLEFVRQILWVHLVFAISTPILWIVTITLALKRFSNPPMPNEHSRVHKVLGWAATLDITATSITGLFWYYQAFIATAV